jgi:hypothetical protein
VTTRLLSFGPRIRIDGDVLVATTGWMSGLTTLGMSRRRLIVDVGRKCVWLYDRTAWWFEKRRYFPFDFVEAVTYDYADWNFTRWFLRAHDAWDVFDVGLRLQNRDTVHLFSFHGYGGLVNESLWHDLLMSPEGYTPEPVGAQYPDSRYLVDVLCKMIGVSVRRR